MPNRSALPLALGAAALLAAVISLVAGVLALPLAAASLVLAAIAAYLGERILVPIACLIIAIKTFVLAPTLWSLLGEAEAIGLPQTNAYRILLLILWVVSLIPAMRSFAKSRWADSVLALGAMALLAVFLGIVVIRVPHGALIVVFTFVFALVAYDFVRTLRQQRADSE